MRIYHDPIRYRDWYQVFRKRENVYVRRVADGNTTFTWSSPKEDGYLVSGFANYAGERKSAWDVKILDMIINAIQQAQGVEYDPGPRRETLEAEKAEKRAFINHYLNWIPEREQK